MKNDLFAKKDTFIGPKRVNYAMKTDSSNGINLNAIWQEIKISKTTNKSSLPMHTLEKYKSTESGTNIKASYINNKYSTGKKAGVSATTSKIR